MMSAVVASNLSQLAENDNKYDVEEKKKPTQASRMNTYKKVCLKNILQISKRGWRCPSESTVYIPYLSIK